MGAGFVETITLAVATLLATTVAVAAATAWHELTHYAAAVAVGADVNEVRLLGRRPQVDFTASNPGSAAFVHGSTVLAAPLVALVTGFAARGQLLPTKVVAAVFVIAYLPRSRSDWIGLVALLRGARGRQADKN